LAYKTSFFLWNWPAFQRFAAPACAIRLFHPFLHQPQRIPSAGAHAGIPVGIQFDKSR
jgi:hypothetical protein